MDGSITALTELRDRLEAGPLLMDGQAAEFANPAWEKATLRILIMRLSRFEDVCRSTPHLFLFGACRSAFAEAYLDFAFFPSAADRKLLEEKKLPLMYGVASGKGMREFDIVLISNSYTLELVNLPMALIRSGLGQLPGQDRLAMLDQRPGPLRASAGLDRQRGWPRPVHRRIHGGRPRAQPQAPRCPQWVQ